MIRAMNFAAMVDALTYWRTDGLEIFPFLALLIFPITMCGIVVWAKNNEERDRPGKVCRVCGYDLRESPVRCPECGTSVKGNPERFEQPPN